MKSIYKLYFISFILCSIFISACKKDYLSRTPINIISEGEVFKDEGLTQAYLYNIYDYLPVGYGLHISNGVQTLSGLGITDLLDGSTDLLRSPSSWNESNGVMIPGLLSANYNPLENWGRNYEGIRKTNNFLFNVQKGGLTDAFKSRVLAEARFLRAYLYFDLVRRYSDVPLITKLQPFDQLDSIMVPRTPSADVYKFIDKELSEASELLPSAKDLSGAELGRATKEAAWALNGRAQLFAKNYARSALFSKKVIDGQAFQLNGNYNALFQSHGGDKEVIFEILFDGVNKGHAFDNLFLPPSIDNGWGSQTLPTQEMVNSYEMINGKSIDDPTSGYDAENPYINRDKRFEASIVHDGSVVKGKIINTGFQQPDDGLMLEGRTITGYYIRKFIDESLPFSSLVFGKSLTSWKEFRLAEVLLNYAEAQNEVSGPDASVLEAINQVRSRAGLPGLQNVAGKDDMFKRIVQERKVELAFEGHRFWDLRRWGMAESVLNNKFFHGMKITKDGAGKSVYTLFELNMVPKQVYLPKFNFMPINQGELNKNPKLTQNQGY
nr:RagB/SusD family nutrient uptake outer membrane protein [Pedobacter panaciterrae]